VRFLSRAVASCRALRALVAVVEIQAYRPLRIAVRWLASRVMRAAPVFSRAVVPSATTMFKVEEIKLVSLIRT
jgi:squalene cyclase